MGFGHEPQPPQNDFAQPEQRALLDRGIEPLKRWIREDLAHAPRWMGFHVTTEWDNNVLACYLSHFLPKLPPRSDYWQQDVLVVHKPEHWQNGEYNRIYTQISGNCLIPETFHTFLLDLTRAFGHRFIFVHDLRFWLERGVPEEPAIQQQQILWDEQLNQAITAVEGQEQGTVERSTIHILNHFGTLEWIAMLSQACDDHQVVAPIYVKGELVLRFSAFHGAEMWRWFTDMRHRGYLSAGRSNVSLLEVQPLSEQALLLAAERIQAVQESKAILALLRDVWGPLEPTDRVQLHATARFGEEAISSVTILNAQNQERIPDCSLPFWQEAFAHHSDVPAALKEAEEGGFLVSEVCAYLSNERIFQNYALPDPKGEHPVFQAPMSLASLSLTSPRLFETTLV